MRVDRTQAILLRRQSKSYNEISKILGISKSTLSDWFKNNEWSKDIRIELTKKAQIKAKPQLKLMSAANKARWERWHEECREEARGEFESLKADPIFLAGLMLYWGEGDKVLRNGLVRLSNSDPEIIKLFYIFLQKLGVNKKKIAIELVLYPELINKTYEALWSKILNIPQSRFIKSAVITGKHPSRRLTYGICMMYTSSRKLKEKIITWIYLYSSYLQKNPTLMYNSLV